MLCQRPPRLRPIAKDVKQFEAGKEIVPGITAVAAPGHTPGHTAFVVTSGRQDDGHVGHDQPPGPVRPQSGLVGGVRHGRRGRRRPGAAARHGRRRQTQVAFYHAPFPATGFIAKEGDKFRFVPAQWSTQSEPRCGGIGRAHPALTEMSAIRLPA